jgi:lysophospholipase L1-like esterase
MSRVRVLGILAIFGAFGCGTAPVVAFASAVRHSDMQSATSTAPSTSDKWENEIAKFEEADRKNPPPKGAVLFIGSSSIEHWKSLAEDFAGIQVINRGFGGSEIVDSTFYVERIVIPYQPRMIVLYAGDNDLADNKTPQQVFEDYVAFVSKVRAQLPASKIAFIAIKPSPAREALIPRMKIANQMIKEYDSHDRSLIYIDVFTPMLRKDGTPRGELFGADGLHMNKDGYALWKALILPYVQ